MAPLCRLNSFLHTSVFILSFCLSAQTASAITAGDVMEKMTEKERFGYLSGLVDMLSYQALLSGDQPRAKCMVDHFYGRKDKSWASVFAAFGRYPDKAPEGLVVLLARKACGQ